MPDVELVFGIVAGRIDFAKFLQRFERGVYKLIYALVKNAADAEELTQDVFVTVHDRLSTYDPKRGTVNTWLFSIAFNRAMSHLRKRSRSPLSLDIMTDSEGPSVAGPDELFEARVRRARLYKALRRLKPIERDAFIGFRVHQLPWKVVAARLACTERAAQYHCQAAVLKLKESL
jgi:RNA polymerase sigma-70 factor (ECF subfamily)